MVPYDGCCVAQAQRGLIPSPGSRWSASPTQEWDGGAERAQAAAAGRPPRTKLKLKEIQPQLRTNADLLSSAVDFSFVMRLTIVFIACDCKNTLKVQKA